MDQSRCAVADVSTRPHLVVDDVVIRFDIQLDSFRVSTRSAIAIRCCQCFRFSYPSSTLAHHRLQIAHRPSQTGNRPTIDLLRIFQTPSTHSQTHSTRLPDSFVSRITLSLNTLTPFDLTLQIGSIDSAHSQPILLLLQLLRLLKLLKAFQKDPGLSAAALCCNGAIHQDVRHQASIAMFSIIRCCFCYCCNADQHVLTIRGFCVPAMVS